MNKTIFRKSGLVSAILVVLACAVFVPAVIADQDVSQSGSNYGEAVVSGVQATYWGDYYFCYWHVGRWLGDCDSYYGDLQFTLYADEYDMSSSTANETYDDYYFGPLYYLGATASSGFYKSGVGTFYWSSGRAELPQ
ncbi:MAG: hypothetical protein CW716_10515 [Candidatus Bathyarchaeum sp.]|nr:MAG: hypothetical protein CW716_10515 [Candidatus Bathyarchaeum sp.]